LGRKNSTGHPTTHRSNVGYTRAPTCTGGHGAYFQLQNISSGTYFLGSYGHLSATGEDVFGTCDIIRIGMVNSAIYWRTDACKCNYHAPSAILLRLCCQNLGGVANMSQINFSRLSTRDIASTDTVNQVRFMLAGCARKIWHLYTSNNLP
jgi:hypothetical protein